jgi:hypothetical protein
VEPLYGINRLFRYFEQGYLPKFSTSFDSDRHSLQPFSLQAGQLESDARNKSVFPGEFQKTIILYDAGTITPASTDAMGLLF